MILTLFHAYLGIYKRFGEPAAYAAELAAT